MPYLSSVLNGTSNWHKIGADLADDSVVNGLRNGSVVKFSDITSLMQQEYGNTNGAKMVENGFLTKMKQYMDSWEVLNASVQGEQYVFVHKNHAKMLLK